MIPKVEIGELFQPGDEVGEWVFSLSATTADLSTAQEVLGEVRHADQKAAQRFFYLHRQVVARIYEAERAVVAMERQAIHEFIATVPDISADVGYLREKFLPADGPQSSEVRSVFGLNRHLTVHHAHVGSSDLQKLLSKSSDESASVLVLVDEQRLVFEFPENAISRYVYPNAVEDDGFRAFTEQTDFAQEITLAFVRLLFPAVKAHAERMGIDAQRLFRLVGDDGQTWSLAQTKAGLRA